MKILNSVFAALMLSIVALPQASEAGEVCKEGGVIAKGDGYTCIGRLPDGQPAYRKSCEDSVIKARHEAEGRLKGQCSAWVRTATIRNITVLEQTPNGFYGPCEFKSFGLFICSNAKASHHYLKLKADCCFTSATPIPSPTGSGY